MRNYYLEDRRRDMLERRNRIDSRMNDSRIGKYPMEEYPMDSHYGYGSMSRGNISYENMREPLDHRANYSDYRSDYNDYARGRGRRDYNDYSMDKMDKEYQEDLEYWIDKLKQKDRIGLSKRQVLDHAKQMGVKFEKYDEMEFYAVYLMLVSDYTSLGTEPKTYIRLAKEWIEDDDVKRKYSNKVCSYLYDIVLGE
jgi:hypothetical protein